MWHSLRHADLIAPAPSPALCAALAHAFPAARIAPPPLRMLKAALEQTVVGDRALMQASLQRLCDVRDPAGALAAFAAAWSGRNRVLATDLQAWQGAFAPFFALPPPLRRLLCRLDPAASLSAKLRRRNLNPPSRFGSAEAALFTLGETIRDATTDWRVAPGPWQQAQACFAALGEVRTRRSG